ncbi:endonuclease/exonuclease/phosphatase family protein [Streptomyces sp. NBC_00425]|uniref:endonuclease/exonuclease/phosphatase family protein n=1 Tax=Streptomyces sp. NBC_00425 TaxID=2975740 RepID=UPI002E1ECD58
MPPNLGAGLRIATWNLRAFSGLTKAWTSPEGASPKRNFTDVHLIAAVMRRFDVVAVEEVRGNLRALRHLMKVLGEDWAFILTDVSEGKAGNDERLAFLFDTRRVKPSGLACELVVPLEKDAGVTEGGLDRQFARTPYAVSFLSRGQTFTLVTLHVLYGEDAAERVPELQAIADWLAGWAEREFGWDHNLIALGDFNIDVPTTRCSRRSPPPAWSPPRSWRDFRAPSSTTPERSTSTTRSPGSPKGRNAGRS